MPIVKERNDAMKIVCLDGVVDISTAAELKEQLLEALAAGGGVCVDLNCVADVDVTWVQLIWAAQREAARAGVKFSFSGPVPERIAAALHAAGFEQHLFAVPGE